MFLSSLLIAVTTIFGSEGNTNLRQRHLKRSESSSSSSEQLTIITKFHDESSHVNEQKHSRINQTQFIYPSVKGYYNLATALPYCFAGLIYGTIAVDRPIGKSPERRITTVEIRN